MLDQILTPLALLIVALWTWQGWWVWGCWREWREWRGGD